MHLRTIAYTEQQTKLPQSGKHIVAQYDDEHIVVYQAYRPAIGHFAAREGYFGGEFKLTRMTWIKPNFLWMMYRCGWGTKSDQEVVLAIWLKREAFDVILSQAVHSSFQPDIYKSYDTWQKTVVQSNVRLQWDPDHDPAGNKLERRAIQLGLRGEVARQYAQGSWIHHIEDISSYVAQQRQNAQSPYRQLIVPQESVYTVKDSATSQRLGLSD